ncbi:MAG: NADH/ubiquinone/plastoquinone (complex I), partial [Dehalococcoidia bacterium]|nr:NADH/ubiquinone/plastoquinone (complex I) [Dehalococcoidia bacterium]
MSALLPALILVPLVSAGVVALAGRGSSRVSDAVANVGMIITTALVFMVLGQALGGAELLWSAGGTSPLGINLAADALSGLMLLVVSVGALAATIYSIGYMESYTSKAKYYVLFMLMVTGLNMVLLGADILNMYVGIEVAALSCYALVAYGLGKEYLEASFKYQVLGTVGTLCLVSGIGLFYLQTGNLSFSLSSGSAVEGSVLPVILLLSGLSLKAAFVPYHAWLPDAHSSAPSPVSAVLSGVFIKVVGLYGLMRLLFLVFVPGGSFSIILMVIAALSILGGAFLALVQTDMKRLLAYCTISQMGYVLLGVAVATPLALLGALFHMVNHAAFKELFFFGAGSVEKQAGTRTIASLGGLNSRMPITGVTSAIGFFSVSGCPPFSGFWSKLIIIVAAIQAGHIGFAVVAALGAVVTIGYFLKYELGVFFGALPGNLTDVREGPVSMWAPMVLMAV